jgi:hypothetical protein
MTLTDFHAKLSEFLYIEDHGMYDILLSSIVANSMRLGDPVWVTLIGPSSGGKSQIIRPFAKANPQLIHRIDDLTSNSLMSGAVKEEDTFLKNMGEHGILCMDDLTVLFSKNVEQRAEILSQFRMLYDGRFSKITGGHGGSAVWEGYVGMIAGSTPSIYRYFGEVADMGERFVNYRMKAFNKRKALDFINSNQLSSLELDDALAETIGEFLRPLLAEDPDPSLLTLSEEVVTTLSEAAEWFCLLRTPVHVDHYTKLVDEFPEPEMPLRVMKQLLLLAKALQVVSRRPLTEGDLEKVMWVGYSLANDKRRAYLKAAIALEREGKFITKRNLSAITGLNEEVVEKGMSALQALGIVEKSSDDGVGTTHKYTLTHPELTKLITRLDKPTTDVATLDLDLI